jgi:protein-disulfide isomerase
LPANISKADSEHLENKSAETGGLMSAKGLIMVKAPAATLIPPVGEHDHVRGPAAAAMTLVEYGDYHDPRCAAAHIWIKVLQAQMGDRLRFVFRHFPATGLYPHAAEAAEAAGFQHQFWEMHDTLFAHQSALGNGHLVEYAQALKLDTSRFLRDVTGHINAERLAADRVSGVHSGVLDSPTFFVNSIRLPSSWKGDLATMITISGSKAAEAGTRDGKSDEQESDEQESDEQESDEQESHVR